MGERIGPSRWKIADARLLMGAWTSIPVIPVGGICIAFALSRQATALWQLPLLLLMPAAGIGVALLISRITFREVELRGTSLHCRLLLGKRIIPASEISIITNTRHWWLDSDESRVIIHLRGNLNTPIYAFFDNETARDFVAQISHATGAAIVE